MLWSAFQSSWFFPARTKNVWSKKALKTDRRTETITQMNKGNGSYTKISLYYRELFAYVPFFGLVLTMVTDLISSGSSVLPWPTSHKQVCHASVQCHASFNSVCQFTHQRAPADLNVFLRRSSRRLSDRSFRHTNSDQNMIGTLYTTYGEEPRVRVSKLLITSS